MGTEKSDWLKAAPKGTKPCKTCGGSGWDPARGRPHTCSSCRGFGYGDEPKYAWPSSDDGHNRGTVRAHERELASGKTVHVRQHQREVGPAQEDDPAARWQARADAAHASPSAAPAAAPKAGPPRPKPKPKATSRQAAERPPLKPKPQRKPRDPLVSHRHAGRLAKKAWRHATKGRRGKAVALGGVALAEVLSVVTLQGIGLIFATIAALAGGIAIMAHRSSSSRQ